MSKDDDAGFMCPKRLGLLRVARQQLALPDDEYRAMLMRLAGVTSSRGLDAHGFDRVMSEFRRLGFTSDWYRETGGTRRGRAKPYQVKKIRELWREFTGGEGTDETLGKWLEPRWHVSSVRFLPEEQASKVLQALFAMVRRLAPAGAERPATPRQDRA